MDYKFEKHDQNIRYVYNKYSQAKFNSSGFNFLRHASG